MSNGTLGFQNPATTDKNLDTESLTVGANTVQRERVQLAGTGATDLAPVSATLGVSVNVANVNGGVAHDAADANSPTKIGAKATTALSAVTKVANNDVTDLFAGVDGVLIVRPHCDLEDIVSGVASNTDGTATQVIAASGDAAIKQYLTTAVLANTSSTTITVDLVSGSTVMATLPCPPGGTIFNPPVPLKPNAANEAWKFDPSAATTTVTASFIGFKSKV